MRAAGVREVSALMELDWQGQRIAWTDFFFAQNQSAARQHGRANVGILTPMPIPEDLRQLLDGSSAPR